MMSSSSKPLPGSSNNYFGGVDDSVNKAILSKVKKVLKIWSTWHYRNQGGVEPPLGIEYDIVLKDESCTSVPHELKISSPFLATISFYFYFDLSPVQEGVRRIP